MLANVVATIKTGIYALGSGGSTSAYPTDYINDDVISDIGELVTTILGWITSNPMLAIFFTFTMLGLAFTVISWLKGVIRFK